MSAAARIAISTDTFIILTPYKLHLFYDYFCHPTPLAVVSIIAAHLQAAFQGHLLAFVEVICNEFSCLLPGYTVDKIGLLLPVLIGKSAIDRQRKIGYCCAGLRIAQLRVLGQATD